MQMRASPPRTPPIIPPSGTAELGGGEEVIVGSGGEDELAIVSACDVGSELVGEGVGSKMDGLSIVLSEVIAVVVGAAKRVSVVGQLPQAMYEYV